MTDFSSFSVRIPTPLKDKIDARVTDRRFKSRNVLIERLLEFALENIDSIEPPVDDMRDTLEELRIKIEALEKVTAELSVQGNRLSTLEKEVTELHSKVGNANKR